jgi:hypothetical protein
MNNDAHIAETVDERSKQLFDEFESHYKVVISGNPELTGKRREIYEGWSIQKISGLQLAVEELTVNLIKIIESKT